ncbi:MAG: hypothetical protein AB1779_01160 [Candidatus Thermoplasmatota archaeon]
MIDLKESQIIEELKSIKEDLKYIKKHMIDIDMILTPDEERILKESIDEFEKGKTKKLED